MGLLWLLAGPMVVQFAVDSVTTAGNGEAILSVSIETKDDLSRG